ncbi:divergent PAP2 family protein [Mycoplasmatota bacterium]|nr:divergent PAP2 family protein [Mycoplasmatota bacterium]
MFFNFPLVTSVIALVIAQLIKLPIHYFLHKEYMPEILLSTGGMPSSHSAFVTALVISIGMVNGIYTTDFAIAFVLAGVVIHDATGIRREAGRHATVLNKMGEDIQYLFSSMIKERNKEKYDQKFKELLGHEPSEALGGIILGILVASILYFVEYGL